MARSVGERWWGEGSCAQQITAHNNPYSSFFLSCILPALLFSTVKAPNVVIGYSNGNDIETKAERSFDLVFVFDMETNLLIPELVKIGAKRTLLIPQIGKSKAKRSLSNSKNEAE
jgi:hypothetical protein